MTRTLVQFIQDRSGSMQDGWAETLNGFKVYVEDLRLAGLKDSVDYFLSLTTFDTLIEQPVIQKQLSEITGSELVAHGPRGGTALYDAVGVTLEKTDAAGFDKIIVIIVTDGQENSSREWKKDTLQKAIEAKINLGNWTFAYLGTQPETWNDASVLGMGLGASANFSKTFTGDTYKIMAARTVGLSNSSKTGTRTFLNDPAYVTTQDNVEMEKISMSVNDGSTTGDHVPTTSGAMPTIITIPPPPAAPVIPDPPKAKTPDKKKWR